MIDERGTVPPDEAEEASLRPTLIQERMRIDRTRLWGIWEVWVGIVLAAFQALTVVANDATNTWIWLSIIVWLSWAAAGVGTLRRARRTRLQFEAQHGRHAGRQRPVR